MADSSSAPAAPQRQQHQHQGRKRPRPKPNNQDSRRGGRPPRRQPNLPKLPPKPSCVVCQTVELVQYKCPKCRVPYCSVTCCKQHKEICTGVPPTSTVECKSKSKSNYLPPDLLVQDPVAHGQRARKELQDNDNDNGGNDDDSLEEGWKITQEMMDTMDKSDWLRKELKDDGGLRQIIFRVMTASDKVEKHGRTSQEEELDRTKADYPEFGNFMDKLLVLAGILERQLPPQQQEGQGGDPEELAPLGEWLKEHLDREELQQSLALKPIPRRTMPVFEPVENPDSSSEDAAASDSASDSSHSSESGSEEASSDEDSDASKES